MRRVTRENWGKKIQAADNNRYVKDVWIRVSGYGVTRDKINKVY
jgi:hypothetical protein